MQVIEAPNKYPSQSNVFLGGGITNCPDWQSEAISLLSDVNGIILNPRRTGAFTEDIAGEQIEWEYHALRAVDTVFFWFPMETLCPITLLELGVFTQRLQTRIIVGTHPDYARRFDVIKQLELARPEVIVHDSIEGMVSEYLNSLDYAHVQKVEQELAQEQEDYERVRQIVLDELPDLIDNATISDLHKVIGDNYKDIKAWHLKTVVHDLNGIAFYITSDGRIISLRKQTGE